MIMRRVSESLSQSAEAEGKKRGARYILFVGEKVRGAKRKKKRWGGPWIYSLSNPKGSVIAFGFTLRI